MSEKKPTAILASLATLLPELEAVYKDIHAHPELSMHETRTAQIADNHEYLVKLSDSSEHRSSRRYARGLDRWLSMKAT